MNLPNGDRTRISERDLAGAREDAQVVRPGRSGATLTEAQRAATCERSERLQVRLRPGYVARLRALSESDGYTVAEWIETWIEEAEREIADALGEGRKA